MSKKTPSAKHLQAPVAYRTLLANIGSEYLLEARPPFPAAPLPPLKSITGGNYTCRRYAVSISKGYFTGLHTVRQAVFELSIGDEAWTTETIELEAAMPHIAVAHGNVIIIGVGLGFSLLNIASKPDVSAVFVFEPRLKLVNAFKAAADFSSWSKPVIEKIKFVTSLVDLPSIDFLYVDRPVAAEDACWFYENATSQPRYVGFLAQEVMYVEFCYDRKLPLTDPDSWEAFKAYAKMPLKIPEHLTFESYAKLCQSAYENIQ